MRAIFLATLLLCGFSANADAHRRHQNHRPFHGARYATSHHSHGRFRAWSASSNHGGNGSVPGRNVASARSRGLPWCGAFMADVMGITGRTARELWIAANWARWGRATTPHVGVVVVWRHHVGKIIGQSGGRWIVLSGNDGHAVRARPRSIAGAIAFRED
jgi:hypothetical protein